MKFSANIIWLFVYLFAKIFMVKKSARISNLKRELIWLCVLFLFYFIIILLYSLIRKIPDHFPSISILIFPVLLISSHLPPVVVPGTLTLPVEDFATKILSLNRLPEMLPVPVFI